MEKEEYNCDTNPYPSFGKKYNSERAIISLTSWKARINTVSKTLYSLIKQCPGFHIVLVLSEEEFPKMMKELPENLMLFVENELIEVLWVYKNYKAFKKVLFAMTKYKNIPIISADDDCIYVCNYAQILYDEWLKNPDCNITNDGSSEKEAFKWGRGPNTLYSPNFTKYAEFLLTKLSKISYNDDDIFYGAICKKASIRYIDIHTKCMYLFHSQIKPLSKQSNKPFSFLTKYFLSVA